MTTYNPSNLITRSHISSAAGRWVTMMTVRPRVRRRLSISRSVPGSRAEVHSSSSRTGAPEYTARAQARRCIWPSGSPDPFSPSSVPTPFGSASAKASAQAMWRASAKCLSSAGVLGESSLRIPAITSVQRLPDHRWVVHPRAGTVKDLSQICRCLGGAIGAIGLHPALLLFEQRYV